MHSPQHLWLLQDANLKLVISLSESDSMVTQVDVQGVVLHVRGRLLLPPVLGQSSLRK